MTGGQENIEHLDTHENSAAQNCSAKNCAAHNSDICVSSAALDMVLGRKEGSDVCGLAEVIDDTKL